MANFSASELPKFLHFVWSDSRYMARGRHGKIPRAKPNHSRCRLGPHRAGVWLGEAQAERTEQEVGSARAARPMNPKGRIFSQIILIWHNHHTKKLGVKLVGIFLGDTTFNVEMMISNSAKLCS